MGADEVLPGSGPILLVDRDELVFRLLSTRFDFKGIDLLWTDSSTGALEILEIGHGAGFPRAVITDVALHGSTGYEFVRSVRGSGVTSVASVPILMLTSRYRQLDVDSGIRSGIDAYMAKPFDLDQLEQVLGRLIRARSKRAASVTGRNGSVS